MSRILNQEGTDNRRIQNLRRQVMIEAFYRRLFSTNPDLWILKGGCALAQRTDYFRYTRDVDLSCLSQERPLEDIAVAHLIQSAGKSNLDHFDFIVKETTPLLSVKHGITTSIEGKLAGKTFGRFNVDIVPQEHLAGTPTRLNLRLPVEVPDIADCGPVLIYPVEDHIADKVSGIYSPHPNRQASTRYRDLADLAVLAHTQQYNPMSLEQALRLRATTRPRSIPRTITHPSEQWPAEFTKYAQKAGINITYESALATAAHHLNPILKRVHSRPGAGPSMTRDAGRSL